MKTGVAALVGGIVGGLGLLCFLVAFGTDYWLLASDDCSYHGEDDYYYHHYSPATASPDVITTAAPIIPSTNATITIGNMSVSTGNSTIAVDNPVTSVDDSPIVASSKDTPDTSTTHAVLKAPEALLMTAEVAITVHHEGFFWRCQFQTESPTHAILAVLFTNQPSTKLCIHGYLFPLPVAVGPVPHPMYDTTAVFRGFWTMLIVLALVAGLVGGFLLVCAVPFISYRLYKLGGIFLITTASLFLLMVLLFVSWLELVDMRGYILQDRGVHCPDVEPKAFYGWSFMVAAAGIPLTLLSGLLFYFIGRHMERAK